MSQDRPHYTPQQLHAVYDRINLPPRFRYEPGDFSREVVRHHDGHGFLGALVTHMLAHIPFENLSLHYSPTHAVSIHPDALFQKFIRQDMGRGGYCLENNVFLGTVMRSLGFDVMSVGARINRMGKGFIGNEAGKVQYGGWSHIVNLVTIRGDVFVVDVGFGPGGPARPLALIDGAIEFNMPPSQREVIRLRRDAIDDNDHKSVKLWIFERRNDNDAPWTPMYCFEDNVCFLPQDFEVMNYFTSTHRTSVYTYRVLCSKFILADKDDTSCTGEIILYENKVTRVLGGKTEVLATLKTEQERVDALYNYLGIRLSLAQVAGIRGMTSELRPGPQGLV
ncbi:hypothetical protein LTR12_010078 [Friedmanniomyces endolithicus]|nr:hypothetical protein LTR74_006484 [Friedmanniomyces endolithicus]KAK1815527.1 hypothetical protein LTR12_010078 [Friedmanniomyces endolithicus]